MKTPVLVMLYMLILLLVGLSYAGAEPQPVHIVVHTFSVIP